MRELAKLFYGGHIYTMSARRPVGDAMIVDGDRVAWIGSAAQLSAVPSDSYEMIDLEGGTILPGFIDSHTHLCTWALSLKDIDLDGVSSYAQALRVVKSHADKRRAGDKSWLTGKGWQKEQWRDIRWPHKSDLDKIVPDRPVALLSKDGHLLWVNSQTLALADINRNTPDPESGIIDKDENGEPTGILKEKAAWQVLALDPGPGRRRSRQALRDGIALMLQKGCVGVTNFDYTDGFDLLQSLDIEGKLPVKVVQYLPSNYIDDAVRLRLRSGFGSEYLKIGGIKLFADGALGSQTAALLKPYRGSRTNRGIEVTSAVDLKRLVRVCTRAGLACAIHAIGDRANRNALDAIQAAGRQVTKKYRHRIEHCQIVSPADIKRFAELNIIASMQPTHATADLDLMKRYLGHRRYDSFRWRTLINLGVTVPFGSDAPIEPLDPIAGIYAAVVGRRSPGGSCFNRKELLTMEAAVHGFTVSGAQAIGQERIRGSLEPGKKADFVILDRDLLHIKPAEILKTKVMATFINGRKMYSRQGFLE
ncbi:MAG: amidohydrolase [candidate division Zixibacteria bacterium]|nr:amidohydrolase [candidate division Zixibacteria bacterium]